jgi:very-short-patch-repair endonuclease
MLARERMSPDEFKANARKFARFQAQARENPTQAELAVKAALDRLHVKYVFQKGFLRDRTLRLVDFYFPSPLMVCLEVDGGYHENQRGYDAYRESRIAKQRKNKLSFVRVTNDWVFAQNDLPTALERLLETTRQTHS